MHPPVETAAHALAEQLRNAPEVAALAGADAAVADFPGARQTLDRLQELQLVFAQAQQGGDTPDPETLAELQRVNRDAQANPHILALAQAQQRAQELMPQINAAISEPIGIDFSQLAGRGGC